MDKRMIIEDLNCDRVSLEELKHIKAEIGKATEVKKCESLTESIAPRKRNSYRATLAKVFPRNLNGSLSEYNKCVFGISLGSKNFVDERKVEACIKWISENFQQCLVLVCDSIYRLTIEVRQGLKEDEAWLEAIRSAENFVNEKYVMFDKYSESCRFEFAMASEVEKEPDFDIYYEKLKYLYKDNEAFQSMVNSFAKTYLSRVEREKTEQMDELKQQQLAITYLIEESAFTACIVKKGWPVVVYPGSIKTFEEISEGLHPEVPEPLKQMIWVSLRLKKRKGAIAQ